MRRFLAAALAPSSRLAASTNACCRLSSLPTHSSTLPAVGVGKRNTASRPETKRNIEDGLINQARDLQLRVRRLYDAGEFGPAIDTSVKLIELSRDLFGDRHVAFASALNNLAAINSAVGDVEKAGELYNYAITVYRQAVVGRTAVARPFLLTSPSYRASCTARR